MRAISTLVLEAGISTRSFRAVDAFLTRVSISAIGSVIVIELPPLPARLGDSRQLALVGKLPEAYAAELELPVEGPGPSASPAAVVLAGGVLLFLLLFLYQGFLSQVSPSLSGFEREAQLLEQGLALFVASRRGDHGDSHAPELVDLVVVDLREDQLLGQAERVVAAAVERLPGEPPEVAHPGERDREQPVQELVHPVSAQRDLASHRHAGAKLEAGHRALRFDYHRPLAGYYRKVFGRRVDRLGVGRPLAYAHVHRYLHQPRHLHLVGVVEPLHEGRHNLLVVFTLEPGHVAPGLLYCLVHQNSRSHFLHTLVIDLPPLRTRFTFEGRSQPGQTSITLETSTGSSQSTTPPCGFAWLGLMCLRARLMPSTTTRRLTGSTLRILPRLPASLPLRTSTVSPLRICRLFIPLSPLEDLGGQGDDLHEVLLPELSRHRPEDPRSPRVHLVVDQDDRVLVELYVSAVRPPPLLLGADHHRLDDLALLYRRAGDGLFDRADHDVAYEGIATPRAAEDLYHQHL